MRRSLFILLVLAGCATPDEQPAPEAPPAPPPPLQHRESIAVAGLMESARSEAASGNLANAAASLERAIRIEPRNPRLWHELASVRLKQGQYAQAESVAARSNSWAGDDRALRAANWRLIAESRRARGDEEGARAAMDSSNK